MNIEQSLVSKSTTETTLETKLAGKGRSKMDLIFPLFNQGNIYVHYPKILTIIVALFFYMQCFIVALWPYSSFYNGKEYKTLGVLTSVFWVIDFSDPDKLLFINLLVVAILSSLIVLTVTLEIVYFGIKKTFMKWTLYVFKFALDIISPLLFQPCASLISASFIKVTESGGYYWAYLVIGIIFYIATFAVFKIDVSLNSKSIILTNSPFPLENADVILNFALFNSLTIMVSSVISIFTKWLELLVIIIHLFAFIYLLVKTSYFPFYTMLDNVLLATVEVVSIIMDVFFIVLFFFHGVSSEIPCIVLPILIVVSLPLVYTWFKMSSRKISKSLKCKDKSISVNEKEAYLDSLGLQYNEDKQTKYLIVGMARMCDMFVDFTLVDYILKQQPSNKMICSLAQKVAFFPGEVRKLNSFLRSILNKRDLQLSDRFMVYQINLIKTLRASSVSIESNEQIYELHEINRQSEADIRAFWTLSHPNNSYCEKIGKNQNNNLVIYKQALETYPNNAKISYEYSRFLTEITTDFDEAIKQQQRAILIEGGRSFATDNSFRSFVRTFPNYLLNEVIDEKGMRIEKKTEAKGSVSSMKQASSSSSFTSSGSDDIIIDAELEEAISKKIIRNSKMRLALHRSISDRKLHIRCWFVVESIVVFLFILLLFVAFYFYATDEFYVRSKVIDNLFDCANFRFVESVAMYTIWLRWAEENGRLSNTDCIGDVDHIKEVDKNTVAYIELDKPFEQQVVKYIDEARFSLNHILYSLSNLAVGGADVYKLSSVLLEITGRIRYCDNNEEIGEFPSTFKDKLIYMLYLNGIIAGNQNGVDIWKINNFCEVYINSLDFVNDATKIFFALDADSNDKGEKLDQILNVLIYIAVPFLFLIIAVPFTVLIIISVKNIQKLLDIMSSLPPAVKEEAQKPIRADVEVEDLQTSEIKNRVTSSLIYGILYFLIAIFVAVVAYMYLNVGVNANIMTTKYNQWFYQAVIRTATSGEVLLEISNVLVFNGTLNVPYTNRSANQKLVKSDAQLIVNANNVLLRGDGKKDAYFGYDDYLDTIHFKEQCKIDNPDNSTHDLYACASVIQQISILRDLIDEVRTRPDEYKGSLDDPITLNLMHIVVNHLWNTLTTIDNRFVVLVDKIYYDMLYKCRIYMAISIIIGILICLFTYYYVHILDLSYSCAISLIKHIRPIDLVASKDMMNYLLNRKDNEKDKSMSIEQTIVYNSTDAILVTGANGVIEIANPAVSTYLGYVQDQLLGQPIKSFFTNEDSEAIAKQMELMVKGESSIQYEGHFVALSDSSEEVHFNITISGMKEENKDEISSFVFILNDETELLRKQKEEEDAKARSEQLLYQILPKNIVIRLNRGEKDISFSIPHASVIFLDIARFSDYTASLTPQEIMGNLSMIFAAFDDNIAKYSTLTKIKMIGDDYMAAGGLFGKPEDPPEGHATEIIKFGLDCLADLDDINVKLNSSLEIRVGVNTGGPLFAGVLGTDKPVFDIIGDTINVAARLQTTDIAGKVQISAATKALVEDQFEIEERGEVFLKGKGKQMTYLVSPLIAPKLSNPSFLVPNE